MKRFIIVILGLCVLINPLSAQHGHHKTKMIELDFKTRELTAPECRIKNGEYFNIVIRNINMNLFKVSFTSRDTVIGKPLETPLFGSFNTDALAALLKGLSPLSTSN